MSKKSMRAVSVFAFQVIDFLVYLFAVFNQLTRRVLITISYLLVISETAKSAAQVFRVLVWLGAVRREDCTLAIMSAAARPLPEASPTTNVKRSSLSGRKL